ncbi:MAG: FadR family transcriptional regulator [Desulfobacterales bacterium]|nr:FadR family transcriptional regulator [Desulfobacterales bacterium]
MFHVARQNRIFQDVVDQIQEAILSGELKPGDMLPPERELKETFSISRGTLREALRVLEQKGLIEIRLGVNGGAVVMAGDTTGQFSDSLDLLIRFQKISLTHLAEFREGVEGTVAAVAAERAGQDDIHKLEALLKTARTYVDQGSVGWVDFLSVDQQVHQELARITNNPIYIFVNKMVHDNIQRYYDDFLPADEKRLTENYDDLCNIVELVKQGRAADARLLAQKHVRRFNKYMMNHKYV